MIVLNQFDAEVYVLSITILGDRSKYTLGLSEEMCIRKVLKHFNIINTKLIDIHVVKNHGLSLKDCPSQLQEKQVWVQCHMLV